MASVSVKAVACLNWQPLSSGYNSDADNCQLRGQELSSRYLWVQCCVLKVLRSPVVAAGPGCGASNGRPEPETLTADKSLWSGVRRCSWLPVFGPFGLVFPKSRDVLWEAMLAAGEVMPAGTGMWLSDELSQLHGC